MLVSAIKKRGKSMESYKTPHNEADNSALFTAIVNNSLSKVEAFATTSNQNSINEGGFTPIYLDAKIGNWKIVNCLLSKIEEIKFENLIIGPKLKEHLGLIIILCMGSEDISDENMSDDEMLALVKPLNAGLPHNVTLALKTCNPSSCRKE